MRLKGATERRLEFRAPARVGALVFTATAMGLVGLLTLVAPTPTTPTRALASAGFLALGALLLRVAVRSPRRLALDLESRELLAGARRVPLGARARLRLSGRLGDVERLKPAYMVDLLLDAEAFRLLEDPDPAVVLEDLRALRAALPLEVESGWGLPAWAIASDALPVGRATPVMHEGEVFSGGYGFNHRAAGWTVTLTGGTIGILMAHSVVTRVIAGAHANAASLVLPAVVVLSILATGAAVLTSKATLRFVGGELRWVRSVLGVPLRRAALNRDALRFMLPVGPVAGHPLHVLLDCDRKLLSMPCPSGDAETRLREIGGTIGSPRATEGDALS